MNKQEGRREGEQGREEGMEGGRDWKRTQKGARVKLEALSRQSLRLRARLNRLPVWCNRKPCVLEVEVGCRSEC